jgi:hypothetical protein
MHVDRLKRREIIALRGGAVSGQAAHARAHDPSRKLLAIGLLGACSGLVGAGTPPRGYPCAQSPWA